MSFYYKSNPCSEQKQKGATRSPAPTRRPVSLLSASEVEFTNVTAPCSRQYKHLPRGDNLLIKAGFIVCVDV